MRFRLVFMNASITTYVDHDIYCVYATLERLEGARDILFSPDVEHCHFIAERMRRRLGITHLDRGGNIFGIGHDRQSAEAR